MTDVDRIGGVPVIMKALLDAGLLHGDVLTVTGSTMAENLAHIAPPDLDGKVLRAMNNPIHPTGGITILHRLPRAGGRWSSPPVSTRPSSRAPQGFSTANGRRWTPLEDGTITAGDVVVIRYEGPKGGPGMRRCWPSPGRSGRRAGQGRPAAHRRPVLRGTTGLCVGHVAPEAVDGGPIAFVADGDRIRLDVANGTLDVLVDPADMESRAVGFTPPPPRYTTGCWPNTASWWVRLRGAVCDRTAPQATLARPVQPAHSCSGEDFWDRHRATHRPLCEATCGLVLSVADGKVTAARGDRDDVFSRGFLCPKGASFAELDNDPDRLSAPLVRREGELVETVGRRPSTPQPRGCVPSRPRPAAVPSPSIWVTRTPTLSPAPCTRRPSSGRWAPETSTRPARWTRCPNGRLRLPLRQPVRLHRSRHRPHRSSGGDRRQPVGVQRQRGHRREFRRQTQGAQTPRRNADRHRPQPHLPRRWPTTISPCGRDRRRPAVRGGQHPVRRGSGGPRRARRPRRRPRTGAGRRRGLPARSGGRALRVPAGEIRRLARGIAAAPRAAVYGRIGTATVEFGTLTSWLVDVINVLTGNLDRPGGAMFATSPIGSAPRPPAGSRLFDRTLAQPGHRPSGSRLRAADGSAGRGDPDPARARFARW